jgi:flagellar biosynthesis/type III secretory pathway M-ring protein FliF/YscJ
VISAYAALGVVILILGLIIALLIHRGRAERADAKAREQTRRAREAEAVIEQKSSIERAVERVEAKQRERQREQLASLKAGRRDQLEDDWGTR